eukprot:m.100096 g.100096  ORF g.100096 m.100096 type:complete len:409 (+) comp8740_c0_seq3:2188-3414(+)
MAVRAVRRRSIRRPVASTGVSGSARRRMRARVLSSAIGSFLSFFAMDDRARCVKLFERSRLSLPSGGVVASTSGVSGSSGGSGDIGVSDGLSRGSGEREPTKTDPPVRTAGSGSYSPLLLTMFQIASSGTVRGSCRKSPTQYAIIDSSLPRSGPISHAPRAAAKYMKSRRLSAGSASASGARRNAGWPSWRRSSSIWYVPLIESEGFSWPSKTMVLVSQRFSRSADGCPARGECSLVDAGVMRATGRPMSVAGSGSSRVARADSRLSLLGEGTRCSSRCGDTIWATGGGSCSGFTSSMSSVSEDWETSPRCSTPGFGGDSGISTHSEASTKTSLCWLAAFTAFAKLSSSVQSVSLESAVASTSSTRPGGGDVLIAQEIGICGRGHLGHAAHVGRGGGDQFFAPSDIRR